MTPTLWLVSFTIFSQRPFCQAKSWKIKNTVFGYKKRWKIQSDMIFWTATPKLWVVSFTIFSPRPLYKAKSWKTQNTVFGYKKWLKSESDRIFWSTTPILCVVSFTLFSQNDFWNKLGFPCFAALFGAFFVACIRKLKFAKKPFQVYTKRGENT